MAASTQESLQMNHQALKKELERLQCLICLGYEVTVRWQPGMVKHHDAKQLLEEVKGNTIFVYTENPEEAIGLVRHGFAEWILNQHTKPYRQLINKLISLFEEQQYEKKEKIVESLANLFAT